MIYIEPLYGLANRMRALASGLSVAKELNTKLVCVWEVNKDLNAPIELLFKETNEIEFRKKSKKYTFLKFSNQSNLFKKTLTSIINKQIGIDYKLKEKDLLNLPFDKRRDYVINTAKKHGNVYLITCQNFCSYENELKHFKPIDEIDNLINETASNFTSDTIGIHIRRTDNQLSIQNSPTSLFIEKIAQNIKTNPDVNFFLSTDDPSVEQELKVHFGDKIICFEKVLSRDSLIGIQHALVDMYCLSKCAMIYGSYWSSFSAMASQLTQIKLEILTKE